MPNFEKIEAPVKINTAAILREANLLSKKQFEEEKIMKDLEMNMRDASEYERWAREMGEKEDIERMEHLQRKKIEMELARQEAIDAKEHKFRENRLNAEKMKVEVEIREDIRKAEKEVDIEIKKDLISKVQDQRVVAEDEKDKVKQKNKDIRDKVHQEINEALERKKEEELAELRKREELIRQIRELEKIPIVRTQGFDPTETAGHGLLNEMSIAELRERLEYEKIRREAETEQKREENIKFKEQKAEELSSIADNIIKARNDLKAQKERERLEKLRKKEAEEAKRKEAREKGLIEAYERISEKKRLKKEEEDRLAAELRKIKLQREYLNADKSMMEKKAWRELEAGAEREARDKQNNKLLDQWRSNGIKVKDLSINAQNNKKTVQNKIEYDKGYKTRLVTRKMENEILHKEVLEYKNTKYAKQRIHEENLKTKQQKMNPFKEKINKESIANATKRQQRKMGASRRQVAERSESENSMEEEMEGMDGGLLEVEEPMDEGGDMVNRMMEMEA
jgi:hypothetical protein